ncbi:DNA repair-scaffolding protein isoform X1 [Bufo gargarizans]|uniref:DNA repair-scaffolding protein isoform X1 n=1 Tax=Bufo gargarizans TaxID=30331 RepID=UPI001CF1DC5B|nr:DNA repair-scaffolding protein isoform X1 [Bufo gargarizans]
MPQGKGKRTSDKIHAVFPDDLDHGGKKSSTKQNLMPQSLSKAWMRCAEGFDGCQAEKSSRSSERKSRSVQLVAHSVVFDEETSADESLKDPADIVWSSSDNEWSDDGSNKTSQPDIADVSPHSASKSQDIEVSLSNDRSSSGDVPHITDWQEDSDAECGQEEGNVSEAAESEVEISDSESVSSDQRQSDVEALKEENDRYKHAAGYSKAVDIIEYSSDDPPDEPTIPVTRAEDSRPVGDENGMHSCGKSASDWLKTAQVLLQTPEKKADVNFKTPEDSAKKKKRFLRGGLAERLNRLHNRERSAITFWRHQRESDCKIPLGDKSGTLILKILEVHEECSMQVALCEQLTDIQDDGNSSSKYTTKLKALFTKHTAAQLRLGPNVIIHMYPPWQKLNPQGQNTSVVINTCFSQRIITNPVEGMESKAHCSSMMAVKKQLVPLSLTLRMDFGKLGVCFDKQQVSGISSRIQSPVSIQDKEFTSNITVNDSLLDLVETQGAAGWKDAYIHVVVQRVYHLTSKDAPCSLLQTKNIKTSADTSANSQRPDCRMGLLIQDAYGIFSELQIQFVNTALEDMKEYCQKLEGKACRLLGIKVLQRVTRGRAPGLFSLIDSLWPPLAPIKIHGQSQDQTQVPENLPAPSFCYILAMRHEKGGDNIKLENATTDLYLPPVVHSLEEILQMEALSQRCSFWATVIYVKPEIQSSIPLQKELRLYVTDTTLQVPSETSINPRILTVCVLPSCALDNTLYDNFSKKLICIVFFKDAVKENGGIICVECTVLSLQKPLLSGTSAISELTGPVRLDELDSSTEANALCTVKGIIIGVNERESYSWPVCNLCGSNKLRPLTQKRCPFYCCQCSSDVSSPVIRMQLEVFVQCQARPQCKVRLKLREETISSILGSFSSKDGRYEVNTVLGKELGPVHCHVHCVASIVSLEEISLLQAASSGDQ